MSEALSRAWKTLGECFAEYTLTSVARPDTRQNIFFAECQRLTLAKDNGRQL
jgi:hypothetical protein